MTQAMITATAYVDNEPVRNYLGEIISETTECETDIPYGALGEVAGAALSAAWKGGIDPAATEGFHLRITFS